MLARTRRLLATILRADRGTDGPEVRLKLRPYEKADMLKVKFRSCLVDLFEDQSGGAVNGVNGGNEWQAIESKEGRGICSLMN